MLIPLLMAAMLRTIDMALVYGTSGSAKPALRRLCIMESRFMRRFWMRILHRSVFLVGIFALASLQLHAQVLLKVQNGSQQTSISLDALKALPHKAVTVHNPHENVD